MSVGGLCLSVGEDMKSEPYSEGMPTYRLNPEFCPTDKIQFKSALIVLKRIMALSLFFLMVSVGGLEPPQIAPHAPQTCASTIPPHRHT